MTAPAMTWAEVLALKPCDPVSVRRRLKSVYPDYQSRSFTMADAAAAEIDLYNLIWLASKVDPRKTRLFAADCAARVSHLAPDPYSYGAIVAARRFARGEIGADELADARYAARADARYAAYHAGQAAARAAARAAGQAAARAAAQAAARYAAWYAAQAAAWDARDAAWDAARAWQRQRLVEWFSETEPEDWRIAVVAKEPKP